MRQALPALAAMVLVALLSGCSGGGSDAPTDHPLASSGTSTAPPPPPVPTTDTLHFLAAPDVVTVLPAGSSEVATPVTVANFGGGPGGGGAGAQGAQWSYTMRTRTNVTAGEVHLWINIKETMFDNPGTPAQPQCTWHLTVAVGSDNAPVSSCINEPPGPINPATRELVYPLIFDSPLDTEANETVIVRLTRTAFSFSANNAVDALSGSTDHDSRITLKGLKEPAPPA